MSKQEITECIVNSLKKHGIKSEYKDGDHIIVHDKIRLDIFPQSYHNNKELSQVTIKVSTVEHCIVKANLKTMESSIVDITINEILLGNRINDIIEHIENHKKWFETKKNENKKIVLDYLRSMGVNTEIEDIDSGWYS